MDQLGYNIESLKLGDLGNFYSLYSKILKKKKNATSTIKAYSDGNADHINLSAPNVLCSAWLTALPDEMIWLYGIYFQVLHYSYVGIL